MGRPGSPAFPREVERRFWRLLGRGLVVEKAAVLVGVSVTTARGWFRDAGGVTSLDLGELSGRYLSFAEREEIAVGRAAGLGVREIARRLGRSPSTISRELARHSCTAHDAAGYRARAAQARADRRRRRPKLGKLVLCDRLRGYVQDKLTCREQWSPEQISRRIALEFPHDEQMRISHETIYRALYVQSRGELRRELTRHLRTGRSLRKPQRQADGRRQRVPKEILISARPAEAADRAVPGHWEGDLILGKNGKSAVGTLVERSTRFVMLLHLGTDRSPEHVRNQIAAAITTLPAALRRTLTWDQGVELSQHAALKIQADIDIYFCDPHSPWQRGSNENTNGLLRQYLPKGTDLSVHSPDDLTEIADALNGRPRKTLNWRTPGEALAALLSNTIEDTGVATTP